MTRTEIEQRIKCLNEGIFLESPLELIILKISRDYTYNKAIALVEKQSNRKDWYSISHKNCFKSWNDADIFLDGFCLAKNTNFDRVYER